eukprot:m.1252264 g.1252264  ORF g.1252264 m.1252264 type:complete len:855 (+) comp24703_c0_seq57:252-2816(+)
MSSEHLLVDSPENDNHLPTWYHGDITRSEAESLLNSHPPVDGLFIVRKSSRDKGFVLSVLQLSELAHYQIRHEDRAGRDFLTFDTESSQGPLFRSLAGVLHYLLSTPNLLPVPLSQWVPCEKPPDVKPFAHRQSPSQKSGADTGLGSRGGNYNLAQTMSDALNDSLAQSGAVYESPEVYAMAHPDVLENSPRFQVVRNRSRHIPLEKNSVIQLVRTRVNSQGNKVIVCRDEDGNDIDIPLDSSEIEVAPFGTTRGTSSQMQQSAPSVAPPALPRRPSGMKATQNVRGYQQFQPLAFADGTIGGTESSRGKEDYYYMEVVKDGWLRKLPPLGNKVQGWKNRWFRLVIIINTRSSEGPVYLEYYDKPNSPKPKGTIDLSSVIRISHVDDGDARTKLVKKVDPCLLFTIEVPGRTYPLCADSSGSVTQWVTALNETLGLEESGKRLPVERPKKLFDSRDLVFKAQLLPGAHDEHGFQSTMLIQDRVVTIRSLSSAKKLTYYINDMHHFGYVKQIVWWDAGPESTNPGVVCFSTPDAEAIWAAISDRVKMLTGQEEEFGKLHRNATNNMSWTTRKAGGGGARGDRKAQKHANGRVGSAGTMGTMLASSIPMQVFGRDVLVADLAADGYAIVTSSYQPKRDIELALTDGQTVELLKTAAFAMDGFYLTDNGGKKNVTHPYLLVKMSCVQRHDSLFNSLDDEDDLLDGLDSAMYEPAPDAVSYHGDTYEEPVSKNPHYIYSADVASHRTSDGTYASDPLQRGGTGKPKHTHESLDYANRVAIIEHNEVMRNKKPAAPEEHPYVNDEVLGIHDNRGQPVLHMAGVDGRRKKSAASRYAHTPVLPCALQQDVASEWHFLYEC